jgi:hypothetical protein
MTRTLCARRLLSLIPTGAPMAEKQLTPVSLFSIEFSMRGNKVIHASDDLQDPTKFKTRTNPSLDVFEEVFTKIIQAAQNNEDTVELMIQDGRFIVRDPDFPLPTAHVAALREALEDIDKTFPPKSTKGKGKKRADK